MITLRGGTKAVSTTTFSGGELHVGLTSYPLDTIFARIQSAHDLVELILANECITREYRDWDLVIPYLPYARQDRITESHVAFSLRTIAKMLNELSHTRLTICDPHSDVAPALLDQRCNVVTQLNLIKRSDVYPLIKEMRMTIVAPDAGAYKKASALAADTERPIVLATKHRVLSTGEITETELYGSVLDERVLIVDDICDGGRTFIELAKILRAAGAAKIYLWVTHGIFSKGLEPFRGLIDMIFTTNSFISEQHKSSGNSERVVALHVLPIEAIV